MSVTEDLRNKLADVAAKHRIECTGIGEVTCRACRDKSWMSWRDYHRHVVDALLPTIEKHVAQAHTDIAEMILPDSVIQAAEKHNSGEFRAGRVATFIANLIRGEIDEDRPGLDRSDEP